MGCGSVVLTASLNGLIIGIVVGLTLGLIYGVQQKAEKGIGGWVMELVPQTAVVGAVIGFSHSILSNCTSLLQGE